MIELDNLSIKYEDFTAVRNLTLSIREGEFFTFLGPSGCGKTTTLRAVAGFEKPAGGRILAFGKDLSRLLPEERDIGFIFQSYALFPSMNVYENIAFGLKAHKVPKSQIDGRVRDIAQKTNIAEQLQKKISDLSGGQQQRIAIARALVMHPKILLMDEPLSNLDAKLRISTREEIKRLQKDVGITTIYVTHDQEEALAISDRVAVFHEGRVEQIGTPEDIYEHPVSGFVARFIGDINTLSGVAAEAAQRGGITLSGETKAYLRPHKLTVLPEGAQSAADNAIRLPGTVVAFEYLGASTKITVQLADGSQMSSLQFGAGNHRFGLGDPVLISFRAEDVHSLSEGSV